MSTDVVDLLRAARRDRRTAAIDPATLPADTDSAYAAALGALDPATIAGWKIGGANAWSQRAIGNTELFFGALLDCETQVATAAFDISALVEPIAEPEVMLEIGAWPPAPDRPLFTRMALGFEIPASVLPPSLKPRLTGQIIDRAGAGGLWIGTPEPFNGARLAEPFAVRFRKNDEPAQTARSTDVFGGPLGSSLLFLGQAIRRGVALRPGQWISSGGLLPAVPVAAGDRLEVEGAGMAENLLIV